MTLHWTMGQGRDAGLRHAWAAGILYSVMRLESTSKRVLGWRLFIDGEPRGNFPHPTLAQAKREAQVIEDSRDALAQTEGDAR